MELEEELAALRARIDQVDHDLGARVAVLERRLDDPAQMPSPSPRPATPPRPAAPPAVAGTAPPPTAARPMAPGGPVQPAGPGVPPPPPPPQPPAQRPASTGPRAPGPSVPIGAAGSSQPPPPSPYGVLVGEQPLPPGAAAPPPRSPSFEVGVEVLLRWVGVALVVLAAVFLVSTAISRGWIGPELQLLGAAIGGLGLLGAAVHLADRRREFSLALGNGGAVVLVVCAGAAYGWLELFSAGPALLVVAAAAVLAVLVADRLSMESIAVTATAAMFVVPTVAEIVGDAPVLATGMWLALSAIAVTVFGLSRGWVLYRIASVWTTALWIVGLASALAADDNTDHVLAGVLLVAVVGVVLWLNPILARRFAAPAESVTDFRRSLAGLEHRSALLLPLWVWLSISLFAGLETDGDAGWFGLLLAAGFAIVALTAGALERWITEVELTSQLLGAGLLTTVAAVSWLGGPTLIVVVAGQALATLVISNFFPDLWLRIQSYLLGLLALLLLAVALAEGADAGGPTVGEHLAYGVVVAALAAMAWLIDRREQAGLAGVAYGLAWLAGVGLFCSVAARFVDDQEWLFVGVALFAAGAAASRRLGLWVMVQTLLIGGLTVLAAAISIMGAADSGATVVVHLANLSVVAALAAATAGAWFVTGRLDLARPLLVVAWVFSLGWIASVLLHVPQGQVAVSGAWAVAACIALVAGLRTGETVVRVLGLGTLGIVLTKLLTVDLAEVETLWRVGLFLVIGLGLLRLGYVLPALAERYGPKDNDGPGGPGGPGGFGSGGVDPGTTGGGRAQAQT